MLMKTGDGTKGVGGRVCELQPGRVFPSVRAEWDPSPGLGSLLARNENIAYRFLTQVVLVEGSFLHETMKRPP